MALIFYKARVKLAREKSEKKPIMIIKEKCEGKSRVFDMEVIIQGTNDTHNQLVNAVGFKMVCV